MRPLKFQGVTEDYFDQLPKNMQNVAKEWASEFSEYDRELKNIECRRRDGFIPYDHNRGGVEAMVWHDLSYFWGGGYSVGVKEAQDAIDKWTEVAFKDCHEAFVERYAEELSDLEVLNEHVNYHDLERLGHSRLANEYCEFEQEFTSSSTTLHQVRVLYNGDGKWTVSVIHRISDAPYHRTCDGYKDWEFKAITVKQLKRNLDKITKEVTEAFV